MTATRTHPETRPTAGPVECPDSAGGVLAAVREQTAAAHQAEAAKLQLAVAWAAMHSVDSLDDAATVFDYGRDSGMLLAGPGAPLVAEFCIAEFAAAIGLATETGGDFLGDALELRYRLPRLWARVQTGDLPAWRARRIARHTRLLSLAAAGFVDAHIAHVAHKVGLAQLDRLITEALTRYDPDQIATDRDQTRTTRHLTIDHRPAANGAGISEIHGVLDHADALDLDHALSEGAAALKALGSTEPLDIRRAQAAGHLARHQPTLPLTTDTSEPVPTRPARPARQLVLYVHLSEAALRPCSCTTPPGGHLARLENTRTTVTTDLLAQWCAVPGAQITVKPLIDLNQRIHVEAYEVPDRLRETTTLTTPTCVFPWCTRPARSCDHDHTIPHPRGPTASENIAPLCRRHHRHKTHTPWRYRRIDTATYLWTSPHGATYLRDHHGTLDLTPP